MIAHCEAPKRMKAIRAHGVMERAEYKQRAVELAPRGKQLPQTKLTPEQIRDIRETAARREAMRKEITATMGNEALAAKYGTHPRNIEKILRYETHITV